MRKRVLLAFGTRPEAIKMAPLYLAPKADAARFETMCCVTAQHREMLDDVLRVFGVLPNSAVAGPVRDLLIRDLLKGSVPS